MRSEAVHGAHRVGRRQVRVHVEDRDIGSIARADRFHPRKVVRVAAEVDRGFRRLHHVPEGAAVGSGFPDPARSGVMGRDGDDPPAREWVLVTGLHDEHRGTQIADVLRRGSRTENDRLRREPLQCLRLKMIVMRMGDQDDRGLVVRLGRRHGHGAPMENGVALLEHGIRDDPDSPDIHVDRGVSPERDRIPGRLRIERGVDRLVDDEDRRAAGEEERDQDGFETATETHARLEPRGDDGGSRGP